VLRINVFVRFQVFTLVSMKIRAFWDIASCTLVGVDQCLEVHGDYHPDDRGRMHL
jgi:hypothetical protein